MNVTCKTSNVFWFVESQEYTISDKHVCDHYGTEWRCIESDLTPGFYTVYSVLGHAIATLEARK